MWLLFDLATGQPVGELLDAEPTPAPGQGVKIVPQSMIDGLTEWNPAVQGFTDLPPPAPMPAPGACIDFHSDAGTALTLTNSPAAARFLGGSNRHVRKIDLTPFRQVRFTARVLVAGSANSQLAVRWHGGSSLNIGDYQMLGVTEVFAPLNALGWGGGQWIDLHPDAIGDNRLIAIRESGGDGAAEPQIGNIDLWLR